MAPHAPYFVQEDGAPWTPIGQNDATSWVDLAGLFRRKDMAAVEAYLDRLQAHGVTCLRLMMECVHQRHRLLERPAGSFNPNMVRLWDDLFRLCEERELRLLLTPYDTFWMWHKWHHHPYNLANGGRLKRMNEALLCAETRLLYKDRLRFAVERWGHSPALFAWDLWNEIHKAQAEERMDNWAEFIHDLSTFVRELELARYGRSHPQTVSIFGPELQYPEAREAIFRHPDLDFATVHFYQSGPIDHPKDTVAAGFAMGRLTRDCLNEIKDGRPFFDSEHGPIHTFKDKKKTLPAEFDDEYFRHMQWAHMASGGAGGGMRWPNRHPHSLTPGMRVAQRGLARFLPLIDWTRFARRCWNDQLQPSEPRLGAMGCGDAEQAVVYLLNSKPAAKHVDRRPLSTTLRLPELQGALHVTTFSPLLGEVLSSFEVEAGAEIALTVEGDLALAVRKAG